MSEPLSTELRSTVAFVACGGILIVVGGVVAAVNSAAPFTHGSWLAAYLVLVGGAAQIALAGGRAAIVAIGSGSGRSRGRLMLWNFGSLAVPAGVLADTTAWVTAGSVCVAVRAGDLRAVRLAGCSSAARASGRLPRAGRQPGRERRRRQRARRRRTRRLALNGASTTGHFRRAAGRARQQPGP